MTTFLMFGSYSSESLKNISEERTDKAKELVKKYRGDIKAGYAMLGEYDLLLIVDLPNKEAAMKVSVGLNKLLDIAFTTAPAITMREFDKLMKEV